MCLARKAPNPILIVLWAHLPSRAGDLHSEDENIAMLPKAKQLLQQDGSGRGFHGLFSLPFPVPGTQKQTVLYCPSYAADLASCYQVIFLLLGLSCVNFFHRGI